jgi:hypothetical protein
MDKASITRRLEDPPQSPALALMIVVVALMWLVATLQGNF